MQRCLPRNLINYILLLLLVVVVVVVVAVVVVLLLLILFFLLLITTSLLTSCNNSFSFHLLRHSSPFRLFTTLLPTIIEQPYSFFLSPSSLSTVVSYNHNLLLPTVFPPTPPPVFPPLPFPLLLSLLPPLPPPPLLKRGAPTTSS